MRSISYFALALLCACDGPSEPQVTEKSDEVTSPVPAQSFTDKAKESIDSIGNKLKSQIDLVQEDLKDLVDDTGKMSEEKIRQLLNDVDKAEPALIESGFELKQVAAEIGLNPGVIVYFRQNSVLSDNERQEILQKYKDSKTTDVLLKSLFYVYSLELGNYQVREAILYVEALPKLRVMLEKKKPAEI